MKKRYTDEFKEQIIKECHETGNMSLVARRYEISKNTIYYWMRSYRKKGTLKATQTNERELQKQLEKVSSENERLKRILGEKDLKLAVIEDLLKISNPQ